MYQSGRPVSWTRSDLCPVLIVPLTCRSRYSTDTGRVLKVVFRTDDEGDSDSVIAENIEVRMTLDIM